jgi:hypothetical protein
MFGSDARRKCNVVRHSVSACHRSHHLTLVISSSTAQANNSDGSCTIPSFAYHVVERVLVGKIVECKHDVQECWVMSRLEVQQEWAWRSVPKSVEASGEISFFATNGYAPVPTSLKSALASRKLRWHLCRDKRCGVSPT